MNEYIATFHTHLSAMLTFQALKDAGCRSRERSAGLPAHAVGKLFLTEEFMRKNRQ